MAITNELSLEREDRLMDSDEKNVHSMVQTLNFLRKNVLNVSDVARTKKLTEILNSFSGTKSEEIFVVQNSKSQDAQGALIDIDYLLELLQYKVLFEETLEETANEMLIQTVQERQSAVATKTLGEVADQFNISWEEITEAKGRVEID